MQGFYNGKTPFGKWKEYYENGKTMEEYEFENGQRNGSDKFFHNNGQLWTERLYQNGKLWDIVCNFSLAGKPLEKGSLIKGKGTLNIYDENGSLLETLSYVDGVKIK